MPNGYTSLRLIILIATSSQLKSVIGDCAWLLSNIKRSQLDSAATACKRDGISVVERIPCANGAKSWGVGVTPGLGVEFSAFAPNVMQARWVASGGALAQTNAL
jgi:hypothetical protein